MVYNDEGEELFNFGKHKGKKVEDVFNIEPSYYSWMMQGDFPLYTKRQLEAIYNRWNAKRQAERQARPAQPKPAVEATKNESPVIPPKKDFKNNNNYQQKPFKREDKEPAKPVNDDMLKQLADKFKKG
jgi:DNA polymerase-3 subunit epsilon